MSKILKISLLITIIVFSLEANGQKFGNLSGGFETTTQYYNDKDTLVSTAPQDKFATNNYLKLDYNYNNIYAGIQYEAYLPPIMGYPPAFEGNGIGSFYVAYKGKNFGVQAGHIYEQFGSGLVYRSWEDRQIGINNSLKGIHISFSPTDFISLKAIYGAQRLNLKETSNGWLRGADAEIDVLKTINKEYTRTILIGGSFVSKYQEYTGPSEDFPSTVNSISTRISYIGDRISFDAEYVTKGKDVLENLQNTTLDYYNNYFEGNALLANLGYSQKGFGVNASFRRVENMNFRTDREYISNNNNELIINYIPALTKQHDYSLANIYVYSAQYTVNIDATPNVTGEIGFQTDIYFRLKKGSFLGGKYGTKIAMNYSQWHGLKSEIDVSDPDAPTIKNELFAFGDKYYHDINIEIKKKWAKAFKSTITYINGFLNDEIMGAASHDKIESNTVIADLTYNMSRKHALRLELQHLWTTQDKKNWMAGTLEYSIAPSWSFYASDMYNYGNEINDEKIHYYNFGGSFTKGGTRFAIAYGRQRGGLLCVGGVCRMVPSATGFTVTINSSF